MPVYVYDKLYGYLLQTLELPEGSTLPENATTVAPDPDLVYQSFDGTTWTGGYTRDEFQAMYDEGAKEHAASLTPSTQDQAMNALGLQVATLVKENTELKQSINALGLQVAKATATDAKEQGGN
ncbi:hypothetical protein [Limosilactobacillus pontis]|uniref:hypothetical protein n=1 Tax=Limosilactobacillus pontis TaxID=35787 RepID=UPI00241CC3FF|nr:hypothetical protein [Limosilactobacillus pontis]